MLSSSFDAQNALIKRPDIKSVTILEHPPRFDMRSQDPMSLKPELATYANNVFRQLWFESKLKHRIVLGKHNLDCSEETRLKRFKDTWNNNYDGVHMFGLAGRRAFTDSVLSILTASLPLRTAGQKPRQENYHNNSPQTRHMNAQKESFGTSYSIPVQNRFNVLGN